jgi:membrane fusion protein, heavy metal efflux system
MVFLNYKKHKLIMNYLFSTYQMKLKPWLFALLSAAFLMACKPDLPTEHHAEENEPHEKEGLSLTPDQYQAVGMATGLVEQKNLNSIIKANGYTTVPPQNFAQVASLMPGIVKDIYVLEGTYVQKGKLLAIVQNLELVQIQEDYQSAMANIAYLKLDVQRQKSLDKEQLNARKTFEEVRAKLAVEEARAQAAKTRLSLLGLDPKTPQKNIPIVAPISGYVGKINTSIGAFAEIAKPLFELVDNRQMHLDLNVYEKDLFKIAIGQQVDFVLTNQSNQAIKGKIFGINKSFSNESKSVAVHAKIEAKDAQNLISGMYVSANIIIKNQWVNALPKDAVVKDGARYLVFVQTGNHQENHQEKNKDQHKEHDEKAIYFEPIEVVPGGTDLGYTEINFTKKIDPKANIVTKGAYYLLSTLKNEGSEHAH